MSIKQAKTTSTNVRERQPLPYKGKKRKTGVNTGRFVHLTKGRKIQELAD